MDTSVIRYDSGMRGRVRELAAAQGLRDEFESFQRLRHGEGISDPWQLESIPANLKSGVLGIAEDTEEELKAGLKKLLVLVDEAPPSQRALLRLCFNVDAEYGRFQWMQRSDDYASNCAWTSSGRTVRHEADVALLHLLMRTREAAESQPAPPDGEDATVPQLLPGTASPSAHSFFGEDYVRNSQAFAEAWGDAETVDMCGFGHNRMLVSYSAELSQMLGRGGRVRVLLQDPESDSVLAANQRSSTPKASDDAVRHQHRAGLATLGAISRASGGTEGGVQVRAYNLLPPFTAYFFNTSKDDAVGFIWFWSWRQASSWRPGFTLRKATDPLWFGRFFAQFQMLWEDTTVTKEIPIVSE